LDLFTGSKEENWDEPMNNLP